MSHGLSQTDLKLVQATPSAKRCRSAQDADGSHGPDVQATVRVEAVPAEDVVGAIAYRAVDGLFEPLAQPDRPMDGRHPVKGSQRPAMFE
jgi:hypothetical protein